MPQLITFDDYSNLPDDNEECFLAIEDICRRNFDRLFNELHPQQDADPLWDSYVSIVYNAAVQCGIEDLSVTHYPKSYDRFRKFQAAVDGLITKIHLRGRRRIGPYSVQLAPNTRTKIEHHVTLLRDAIENSHLAEWRKELLLEKLDELRAELDSRRLNFGKVMAVFGALLVGTTTVAAGGPDAFANIGAGVTSIIKLIGKDKETEDAALRRLAPPSKALPAPSDPAPESSEHEWARSRGQGRRPASSVDDDIPF